MDKTEKKSRRHKPQKNREKACPYCGSENIEQVYIKHVGAARVCRDCREEF
jgi:transcription elongation factor Elf1